ncbi:hypothetical protein ND00_32860 [Clostridium sp. L74]|nr:hypothetical protein ND00_32860 [Clostridium sp. L74]
MGITNRRNFIYSFYDSNYNLVILPMDIKFKIKLKNVIKLII